jgi:hypothetical protein
MQVCGDTHCALLLQVVGQVVAPSQRKFPHELELVPAATAVHVPGVALHASQPSAHEALQQYPLAQYPVVHEEAPLQALPVGIVVRHEEPPLQ